MLQVLVTTADSCGDATALLHESVTLHRLDGTAVSGRVEVADAISTRGSEARLRVVGEYGETVHVAMEMTGVPGRLVFTMSATVRDGLLAEIWMD